MDELLEQMADGIHASWSHWMEYLFSRCIDQGGGALLIPREFVERWQRQMHTEYANLSETEKISDRREAMALLSTLYAFLSSLD